MHRSPNRAFGSVRLAPSDRERAFSRLRHQHPSIGTVLPFLSARLFDISSRFLRGLLGVRPFGYFRHRPECLWAFASFPTAIWSDGKKGPRQPYLLGLRRPSEFHEFLQISPFCSCS